MRLSILNPLMQPQARIRSGAWPRSALVLAACMALGACSSVGALFLPKGGLLAHMPRIARIPADIVQGRYDMVCPPVSAFDLAAQWPAARLTVIPDAGHSALEPGVRRALVAAVERFRERL